MILGQVSSINAHDIALSLPNNLTGYVPLTSISKGLEDRLEKMLNDEGEDDEPGPVLLGGDEAAQTLAGAEAVTGEGVPVAVDTTRITIIEED